MVKLDKKIIIVLKESPKSWEEIHRIFGDKSFKVMKELIEQNKIKSIKEDKWEINK